MARSGARGPTRARAPSRNRRKWLLSARPACAAAGGKTHPLAATLLLRAMIDDTLDGAKSTRYKHAARHLIECQSLASAIQDYGLFETHQAFVARLRAKHGRKSGFWSQFAEIAGARSRSALRGQ